MKGKSNAVLPLGYAHELNSEGTDCAQNCVACNWLKAHAEPPGEALSTYRWMEEQAKLPKTGERPK
jgi:hypothetical protein